MNYIINDWLTEYSDGWVGQAMSLKVKEILESKVTKFQDLLIFKSTNHRKVVVLDGIIQLTKRDEFLYQEMTSMLPLSSHPNPQNQLIIGGGDGGVMRDVAEHNKVKKIIQCEIDEEVVNLSKKHLPFMAVGYDNDKAILTISDGFEFLKQHKNEFDIIITQCFSNYGSRKNFWWVAMTRITRVKSSYSH